MTSIVDISKYRNIFWKSVFQETDLVSKLMNLKWNTASFEFELKQFRKTKLSVRKAVSTGTNFLSDVFTVTGIVNNDDVYQAFIKVLKFLIACINCPIILIASYQVLPSHPSRTAASFIASYYEREASIYLEWFPEIRAICLNKGLSNTDIPLSVADSYYLNLVVSKQENSYGNDTVYVLENLNLKGFQMISAPSKTEGIDFNHAKLAVQTYANYHALSIANYRQHKRTDGTLDFPESYQVFNKSIYYIHPVDVYRTLVIPNYCNVLRHFHHSEVCSFFLIFP